MFKKRYNNGKPKGFTLIELLVVIALLGILSGGILIALNITGTIGKASLTKAKKFAAQLENGLAVNQVGKWSFEDGSGDAAKDTSGYGNDGDLAGACPGVATCATWRTASECVVGFGGCLEFDGVDDYVRILPDPSLNVVNTKNVTLAAWVNPDTLSGHDLIVSKGLPYISRNGSNASFTVHINEFGQQSIQGIKTMEVGKWYHIVGTYDGTWLKVYLNGDLDNSTNAYPGTMGCCDPNGYDIGRDWNNSAYTFDGLIDEVQIYNQALTLSKIQELYAQGFVRHLLARK